jgi:hypothetical protein
MVFPCGLLKKNKLPLSSNNPALLPNNAGLLSLKVKNATKEQVHRRTAPSVCFFIQEKLEK